LQAVQHSQHSSPQQAASRVRRQIGPARRAARQEHLVQLVHAAHQQRASHAAQDHAPAAHAAGQARSQPHYRKGEQVSQFVPGRGKEAHGHGLGAGHIQHGGAHGDRQCREDADGALQIVTEEGL
jgi:hypothetical protein